MNYQESKTFLDDLMLKNHFYMAARTECLYKNEPLINSMQDIFKLKRQSDFTYLYAVSELLSDDFKNINDYLLNENKDSEFVKNIPLPTRKDKILVATAFEENLEFFSMAWNWVAIVTAELAENKNSIRTTNAIIITNLFETQSFNCDYFIPVAAAGTNKTNNITSITVDPLGELQIQGYEGDGERKPYITFVLFLKEEYQTKKFEIDIEYVVDGKKESSKIIKGYAEADYDISSEANIIDFSKGLRITNLTWKPIE